MRRKSEEPNNIAAPLHLIVVRAVGYIVWSSEFSWDARSLLWEVIRVSITLGGLFILPIGLHWVKGDGKEGDKYMEYISIFWEHQRIFSAIEKLSNNNI